MSDIKISAGEFTVYSSGSVISVFDKPIKFELFGLEYEIMFIKDDENPAATYTRNNTDETKQKQIITIKNFNDKTGNGVTKPIFVGYTPNDKIYLSFIVYSLSSGSGKLFCYTWFLKSKTK
jgi:hypothetical protein